MGEVVNSAPSGSATPCFVKAFLEFYDASARLIASDWTYVTGQCNTLTSIDSETGTCVAPQKRGAFGLYTAVNIASVNGVRVTFDYDTPQISTPDARVQVESGWFASPAYDSTVFIEGRMKNTSAYATAKFCQETAVFKAFDGGLLDVDWTTWTASRSTGRTLA